MAGMGSQDMQMRWAKLVAAGAIVIVAVSCAKVADIPMPGFSSAAQWDNHPQGSAWTEATVAALRTDGADLISSVPGDVGAYCPAYAQASPEKRQAFWVGLVSGMAKYESGWNPLATGGGGKFLGLMQISDDTAAQNGCARGDGLLDGRANLSCAVRIMSRQVAEDGAIFEGSTGGWRAMARDWMPFRKKDVREDLASWTSKQSYCN